MKNKKFDLRDFLKNTKIELGEYKTTIEDKAFKGYNDLRRDNHEVIITEGGKLNLHTRKEVTVNKSINEWGSSDQNIMNKSIHKDAGSPSKMPSPFDSKLRAAAEEAVDWYWNDWPEYKRDRDDLIDTAVRYYLRAYFPKEFSRFARMFESTNEAKNIKKADMRVVSKKEWDRTNKDYKGIRNGQPYMMWFDEETQSTVYGPVHIKK